jgi:hypothetical protein
MSESSTSAFAALSRVNSEPVEDTPFHCLHCGALVADPPRTFMGGGDCNYCTARRNDNGTWKTKADVVATQKYYTATRGLVPYEPQPVAPHEYTDR